MMFVVGRTREAAMLACDTLEQMGILNPAYRHLRDKEVRFVSSNDPDAALQGRRIHADDVVLVDGWEHGTFALDLKRSLSMTLGMERESLDECVNVQL